MSAAKARTPRMARTALGAETIPLAGVSITIARRKLFGRDGTVTFDGERLATALRYVALTCPNLEHFSDAESVAIELAGIAEICKGLSDDADLGAVDCHAVFNALFCRLDDLASRVNAGGDRLNKLEMLTITRKPAVVAP